MALTVQSDVCRPAHRYYPFLFYSFFFYIFSVSVILLGVGSVFVVVQRQAAHTHIGTRPRIDVHVCRSCLTTSMTYAYMHMMYVVPSWLPLYNDCECSCVLHTQIHGRIYVHTRALVYANDCAILQNRLVVWVSDWVSVWCECICKSTNYNVLKPNATAGRTALIFNPMPCKTRRVVVFVEATQENNNELSFNWKSCKWNVVNVLFFFCLLLVFLLFERCFFLTLTSLSPFYTLYIVAPAEHKFCLANVVVLRKENRNQWCLNSLQPLVSFKRKAICIMLNAVQSVISAATAFLWPMRRARKI